MKKRVLIVSLLFALCAVALPSISQNQKEQMRFSGLDRNKNGNSTRNEWSGNLKIIPSGTEFVVRSKETIDSKTAAVGQLFLAVIDRNIRESTGTLAIPKGSNAELVLQKAKGGSMTTASELVLDLEAVTVAGTRYLVITGDVDEEDGRELALTEEPGRLWDAVGHTAR